VDLLGFKVVEVVEVVDVVVVEVAVDKILDFRNTSSAFFCKI
jgi:hypothetical protein